MERKKVATSHAGRYSYWLDADNYVYQYNEETKTWVGWLCSAPVWERWSQLPEHFTLVS